MESPRIASGRTLPLAAPRAALKPQQRSRLYWAISDTIVIARRNLMHIPRIPMMLLDVTIQPIIFVVLFRFVFGGAVNTGPVSYVNYLMPGIFVQTLIFACMTTGVGMAEDLHRGLIDRFRSLPMAASAVLFGRTTADAVRQILVLVVLSVTGYVVGWRINDGVANAVLAYLLLLLFAYTVAWVGAWVGLHMPNPQTASTAGLIWLFPLTFLSNAFVPLAGMPAVVKTIAEWNPVSTLVLACRELFGNPTGIQQDLPGAPWSLQHPEAYTLISCVVIIAIFSVLAVRKYRRTTA